MAEPIQYGLQLQELLYQCIRELDYVQCCAGADSNLSATSKGKELIQAGMELLNLKDLSAETLVWWKSDTSIGTGKP